MKGTRAKSVLERFNRWLLLLKNFKQIQHANQLEGLQGELRGPQQFQRATALFGSRHMADQQADAARIDHGNFLQVEKEAGLAGVQEIGDGFVGAVQSRTEIEPSFELN